MSREVFLPFDGGFVGNPRIEFEGHREIERFVILEGRVILNDISRAAYDHYIKHGGYLTVSLRLNTARKS